MECVDLVQPPQCDTLCRHEVVEGGDYDGGRSAGDVGLVEPLQATQGGCLPTESFARRCRNRIDALFPCVLLVDIGGLLSMPVISILGISYFHRRLVISLCNSKTNTCAGS